MEVGINHAHVIDEPMEKLEPHVETRDDRVVLRGSEFLSTADVPFEGAPAAGALIPQGGAFMVALLNPLYLDGLRIARMLSTFDQFKLRKFCIEYIPVCPSTQAGGLVMVMTNDTDQNMTLHSPNEVLRDALSRPGAVTYNVYAGAVCHLNQPQQEWYYTRTDEEEFLTQPGLFYLLAATNFSTGASTLPLGLLWMHYEIEVRSPSLELPASLSMGLEGGKLEFGVAITAGTQVIVPIAAMDLPAGYTDMGEIGSFTVTGGVVGGFGNFDWRLWENDITGEKVQIVSGMRIYFRLDGGGLFVVFFPSYSSAAGSAPGAQAGSYEGSWNYVNAAGAPGAPGTILMGNLSGSPIEGSVQ